VAQSYAKIDHRKSSDGANLFAARNVAKAWETGSTTRYDSYCAAFE
jgi:hypothetical protein